MKFLSIPQPRILLLVFMFVILLSPVSALDFNDTLSHYYNAEADGGSAEYDDKAGNADGSNSGVTVVDGQYDFESSETDRIDVDDGDDWCTMPTINAVVVPESHVANGHVLSWDTDVVGGIGKIQIGTNAQITCRFTINGAEAEHTSGNNVLTDGQGAMITCVFDDANDKIMLYVNGVWNSETGGKTGSQSSSCNTDGGQIGNYFGGTASYDGLVDNVSFFSDVLTATEIGELYGFSGNPNADNSTAPSWPSPILDQPVNNTHNNNDTIYFIFNKTAGVSTNCTYYFNGTAVYTETNNNESQVSWGNSTMTEGHKTWSVNCYRAPTNSSTYDFYYDSINPAYTEQLLATDNSTVFNRDVDPLTQTFTGYWFDSYMFGWNFTIYNSSGDIEFSNQTTNLTGMTEWVNHTINMSSWADDNYTTFHYGEDDHTSSVIPEYLYEVGDEYITYYTPSAEITITTLFEVGGIATQKLPDRYTFEFDTGGTKGKWSFELSSDEIIYYRGPLYDFPSFVIGSQWIDFKLPDEVVDKTYTVQYKNPYLYELEIEVEEEYGGDLVFESLGGLNNATYRYMFEIVTCTPSWTNTSWSAWSDVGECTNSTQQQNRSLTEYDANFCSGSNSTIYYQSQYVSCTELEFSQQNTWIMILFIILILAGFLLSPIHGMFMTVAGFILSVFAFYVWDTLEHLPLFIILLLLAAVAIGGGIILALRRSG